MGTVRFRVPFDFGISAARRFTTKPTGCLRPRGLFTLVVWRANPADDVAIKKDVPPGCDPEQWKEYNRHRPLDYWLDYIFSLQPNARWLGLHLQRTEGRKCPGRNGRRDTRIGSWNASTWTCLPRGTNNSPGSESPWLGFEACGRGGTHRHPTARLFQQVAGEVDSMLEENSRNGMRRIRVRIWTGANGRGRVRRMHAAGRTVGRRLNGADVGAITGYLHDAGLLFQLDGRVGRAVLVDQDWATEIIYEMLGPGGGCTKDPQESGLVYAGRNFRRTGLGRSWKDETQRERLVRYLEQCRLIVPPGNARMGRESSWPMRSGCFPKPTCFQCWSDRCRRFAPFGNAGPEAFGFGDATITSLNSGT